MTTIAEDRWVLTPMRDGATLQDRLKTQIAHLDGLKWYEAPIPRRLHRCSPQSRVYTNYLDLGERCACGASRRDGRHGRWERRNSRRKERS